MDLNDITPENFFRKITFNSNQNPLPLQLKIPDGEFFQCAIMLKLIRELQLLRQK
jgi:hypothetical protein